MIVNQCYERPYTIPFLIYINYSTTCIVLLVWPYPDCTRCNYTKGQVWFPDPDNCHLYYICDKIDRMDGSWYFRVYHPTCGQIFWDQERLTCVRSNANCTDAVVEYTPPSTTFGKQIKLFVFIILSQMFSN